jgi:hypothetical protein
MEERPERKSDMQLPVARKPILKLPVLPSLMATARGIKKDGPAPGCVGYRGLAPMGGCYGKSVMLDLHVQPALDCLTMRSTTAAGPS